jgi:F-type H+-transporting ATPase subunit b
MKASSDKEAGNEETRLKASAEEEVRKVIEAAEQEIVAATKAARRELTAYAADLAVSLAQKEIHVDAVTDDALLRSFARQLSGTRVDRH